MQENMFGQNIIITERVSTLRQLGRNALRGKWKSAIMASIIYLMCVNVPIAILDKLFGYNPGNVVTTDGYTYGIDPQVYNDIYNIIPKLSILAIVYVLLVGGAFTLGMCLFYLASFRGHRVFPKDVFLGFERFPKALGLFLYQYIFVFLWSLLFLIPGIIAVIRYSQAFYVLADDPEKSIRQCMDESKMMMKGNKAKYFVLELSFIGWYLLASFPVGIISGIVSSFSDSDTAMFIMKIVSILFVSPVMAYVYSTNAGFYEILSGHLIKETAPAPVTAEQIAVEAPMEAIEEVIETEEKIENAQETDQEIDQETDQETDQNRIRVEDHIDKDAVDSESEGKE